ncbi:MAG TPA: branched-chain amino acid ABC transporter permease [Thermodesulfobacteriota bacterium]|nr:branched-chain amino acid ABC transporter permease [Thermodesulfobacteriota bacterium]
MDLLIQLTINGLSLGSVYALLGISWGLIFAVTRTFHFAHGATFVVACYSAYLFQQLGLPLAAAALGGILGAVLFGMAVEGILYRFLRRSFATPLVIFVAALGTLITVENLIAMGFGTDTKPLEGFPLKVIRIGRVGFNNLDVVMFITAGVLFAALMLYLHHTKNGKALRAVISNPEMAEVIGIDTRKYFLLAFALGSLLVAPAGVLVTIERGATPDLGHWAILYAFMPVIIGGIGSIPGAALAGFIIGLAESIGIWKISSQWQVGIAFVVLVVVLILKPTGLFGFRVYRGKI